MTVLDVTCRYRKTHLVFKECDEQAGECVFCQALFDPLKKVTTEYGLGLERLLVDLEAVAD